MDKPTLASAAHVVQLALTPVFLLSAMSSLLGVFTNRLGQVAERVEKLIEDPEAAPRHLNRMRLRSWLLDSAVVLATLAGAQTCCAVMVLFLGALRDLDAGVAMFALFGGALACAILSLTMFATETLLSGYTVRERTRKEEAEEPEAQRIADGDA